MATKYQCRDSCQNQSHFPCPVVAGVTGDLQVFLILTGIIRGPSHNEGTCRHQLSVSIINLWTKTSFQLQVSWSIGLFAVRRWWHIVAEVGPGVNLLAIWSESYMNEGLGSNDSLSIHTKVTLRWPRRSCFLIVQFFLIVFYWGHPFNCRPLGGHLKAEVWGLPCVTELRKLLRLNSGSAHTLLLPDRSQWSDLHPRTRPLNNTNRRLTSASRTCKHIEQD